MGEDYKLEEFKNVHNMTPSQYNMASALCKDYFRKMASIENLSNIYQGMKMASVAVDLDIMVSQIEKKFKKDFDNILGM